MQYMRIHKLIISKGNFKKFCLWDLKICLANIAFFHDFNSQCNLFTVDIYGHKHIHVIRNDGKQDK